LPLLPVQLLWLNLVTNGIQDIGLAFEAGERGAIQRPPRKPTEGIFSRLMIEQTLVSGTTMALVAFVNFYLLLEVVGLSEFDARDRLLLLMVLLENYHVFNCRSEYVSAFRIPLRRNWMLVLGVLGAQGIHIMAMHIPLAQKVLQIAPISLNEWLVPLLMASSVLVVMEIFKVVRHGSETAWAKAMSETWTNRQTRRAFWHQCAFFRRRYWSRRKAL
jgi:magnesium-transporting ATPase (P-type)